MDGADLRTYAQLRGMTDALNLRDQWAWDVFGNAPWGGLSCRFTDGDISGWDRGFDEAATEVTDSHQPTSTWPTEASPLRPDVRCLDLDPIDPPLPRHPTGVGRYDYVFVERPSTSHRYRVEVSRIRRRPFPRPAPSDGERYLSDHLGLDLTLFLSSR